MDILITFVIILIICMAVAPFFLLSGEFGAKRKPRDDGTGLMTPVPGTGDGPIFPKKPADSNRDDDGDGNGDGEGGGGGGDGGAD
jgi:hypothetical protein